MGGGGLLRERRFHSLFPLGADQPAQPEHRDRAAGAAEVIAFATHGVFVPESRQLLGPDGPDQLIVTDSILPTRIGDAARAPVVLPVSGLYAEAIRRISSGESVVALRELQPKRR